MCACVCVWGWQRGWGLCVLCVSVTAPWRSSTPPTPMTQIPAHAWEDAWSGCAAGSRVWRAGTQAHQGHIHHPTPPPLWSTLCCFGRLQPSLKLHPHRLSRVRSPLSLCFFYVYVYVLSFAFFDQYVFIVHHKRLPAGQTPPEMWLILYKCIYLSMICCTF